MLTSNEVERLREAIIATIAAPVVGSIEDYSWEAIFHYVKNIPLSDPTLVQNNLMMTTTPLVDTFSDNFG